MHWHSSGQYLIMCSILWLGFAGRTQAQTKGFQEVEIDLGSGSFVGDQGLPFDVPFRVRGPITANLRKVTLKYRIKPSEFVCWMRFPNKTKDAWSEPVTWGYIDEPAKDQKFRLTVGPLHPNVGYEFSYTILKTPSLNVTQREELKKTIFESLTFFLQNLTDVTDNRITQLNNELNQKLKVAVGGASLKNADETDFVLNILADPLQATTRSIIDYNLIINDNNRNIGTYSTALSASKNNWLAIRQKLADIKSGRIVLSGAAKAVWDAPVSPSIQAYKDLKVKELAELLANPGVAWSDVLLGTMKIDKSTLVAVNATDVSSLELLNAFFNILHAGTITAEGSGDVFSAVQANINEVLPAFAGIEEALEAIKKAEQKKAELLTRFPDVLADKLISLSFITIDRSVPDVVSQATPYIGLDFGFSFTPNYSQLFAYEGVNYYFVPVNKDAPLSTMKGLLNNISKRMSVHMGLTQSLIAADNKNYQPLINNVGSLLIGAGVRFSRIVRLNYGTIFFYEKNPNPLISDKNLKSMYTFSMTFDVNIAKALGSVGTRLGR